LFFSAAGSGLIDPSTVPAQVMKNAVKSSDFLVTPRQNHYHLHPFEFCDRAVVGAFAGL
jgi:hypothetical protein